MSNAVNKFIRGLKEEDRKIVRNYLASNPGWEDKEGKERKLFELLTKFDDEEFTDEALSKKLYKISSSVNLRQLRSRLFNKVLESLSAENNHDMDEELDRVTYKLKKRLLQYRVLFRKRDKNIMGILPQVLDEVIQEAKKMELYDVLVEALNWKKYSYGIRAGIEEFETISKEIEHYEYCYRAVLYAADCYFRLVINKSLLNRLSENEINIHITGAIDKLEEDLKRTASSQVNYYLKLLQFALNERKANYKAAAQSCIQLIDIIKKNKSVYRKERLGFAHDNLSQCEVYLGNYAKAVENSKQAQEYYLNGSFNNIISKEQEFYACFYDHNYKKSLELIDQLILHPLSDAGEFRKAKFSYYKACVYFMLGDFKKAFFECNQTLEISKDKMEWGISLRILNIMLMIEFDNDSGAASATEALKKHIQRTGKEVPVKNRYLLVQKALYAYEQNGFRIGPSVQKVLNDLVSKNSPDKWELFTSELIPFENWLQKRS
jgi:hypothetical protein